MYFSKVWVIAGLLAVAIAAVGLGIATADQTGSDSSGGVFSTKVGL